jgi:hypothetical protein
MRLDRDFLNILVACINTFAHRDKALEDSPTAWRHSKRAVEDESRGTGAVQARRAGAAARSLAAKHQAVLWGFVGEEVHFWAGETPEQIKKEVEVATKREIEKLANEVCLVIPGRPTTIGAGNKVLFHGENGSYYQHAKEDSSVNCCFIDATLDLTGIKAVCEEFTAMKFGQSRVSLMQWNSNYHEKHIFIKKQEDLDKLVELVKVFLARFALAKQEVERKVGLVYNQTPIITLWRDGPPPGSGNTNTGHSFSMVEAVYRASDLVGNPAIAEGRIQPWDGSTTSVATPDEVKEWLTKSAKDMYYVPSRHYRAKVREAWRKIGKQTAGKTLEELQAIK